MRDAATSIKPPFEKGSWEHFPEENISDGRSGRVLRINLYRALAVVTGRRNAFFVGGCQCGAQPRIVKCSCKAGFMGSDLSSAMRSGAKC
jgi:hypothetical protein